MAPLFASKPKQPDGQAVLTKAVIVGIFLGLTYAIVSLELAASRHTALVPGQAPRLLISRKSGLVPAKGSDPEARELGPLGYPSTADVVARLSRPEVPNLHPRCHVRGQAEFAGPLAGVPMNGGNNKQPDPGACCSACLAASAVSPPCNAWVWHNITHDCWLKNFDLYPERPIIMRRGPDVPWVSGSFFDYGEQYDPSKDPVVVPEAVRAAAKRTDYQPKPCIHTVLTSNGNAYMNWQTRVMYATYKAAAAAEGPDGLFKAFTRVLHRAGDDELMKEVPSMRFPPKRCPIDAQCSFPVADRSQALWDWSQTPDSYQCSHIMMVESDYIYVRALPKWILPARGHAVGFHFGYIDAAYPTIANISRRFFAEKLGRLEQVPQTGNAPQILHADDFRAIMPVWAQTQEQVEADKEAVQKFEWIRDMYAYSFAVANLKIRHHVPLVPYNHLMVQPPADEMIGDAAILHYTWGPIISVEGKELWRFDKRQYQGGNPGHGGPVKLIKLERPPAFREGMRLQAGEVVTPNGLALIDLMVDIFNQAVDSLPEIPVGYSSRDDVEKAARDP